MKKGFTLIELLAVIVILAIIAVIAVPIVINIIAESKKNATLRSADFYLDAVEQTIAQSALKNKNIKDGTYNILQSGNICLEYTDTTCTNELIVEVKGEVPNSGTITIENKTILGLNVLIGKEEIVTNSKGELVRIKKLEEVCKHISGTAKTAGAKYECQVNQKHAYIFYVLTTPTQEDTRINLIMEQNINSDGTPVTKAITKKEATSNGGIYNLVDWISIEDFVLEGGTKSGWYSQANTTVYGPVTPMNFISEATKSWTNTNEMIINSFEEVENFSLKVGEPSEMKTYNTYARLPYASEIDDFNETNGYLYDYLAGIKASNNISGIYGYWTLTYRSPGNNHAWYVSNGGYKTPDAIGAQPTNFGVRPVISLKL